MPNYRRDKMLEQPITFATYMKLVREPATAKNAGRIKALQDRRVHEVMKAAWGYPFYRERFEGTGTTPDDYHCAADLYKFPVLTKAELRDWMDDELERYPEKYADWHVSPTSGSTGLPLRVLVSPREHALWTANWLRTMALPGFDPFTGKTLSRPNTLHGKIDTSKGDSPIQKLGILRHRYMSDTFWEHVETRTLVDEINDYEPDYFYCHKNVMVRIAKYIKENDLYVWKPSFYSPISEMLDAPSTALLHEVFGPGLVDTFGLAETGTCVVRIPGNDYYQIHNDSHVVNTYNEDLTGPAPSGMAVITNLMKLDLPLVNYTSLDYMDTFEQHGLPFVSKIVGRMNDVIHLTNGDVKGWANIIAVMNYTYEVVAYRLIQDAIDHVHLLMVRKPDVPADQEPEIAERVKKGLLDIFGDPNMNLTTEWVADIPSDPNGKLRVIINKMEDSK